LLIKLNGKLYEVEDDKIEDLLTEQVISKIDLVFEDMGAMSGIIKSTANSFLSSKGFKKIEGFSLIESSLIEIISSLMEENKHKILELELKEVELPEVEIVKEEKEND
jgi:hypothetical protein